jgi:phosphoribosylformylglycinamidine synthase subunit PurQ / glutaminase
MHATVVIFPGSNADTEMIHTLRDVLQVRTECRDVFVTPRVEGPFTSGLPRVLRLPIAHAEGRYQADPETLRKLVDERAIALQYCDREGLVGGDANPNGSAMDIAGIYGGPRRNVLGLMPHPERMSEPFQGQGCADGRALFDAVLRSVSGARSAPSASAP